MSNEDKVQCQICFRWLKLIAGPHLKKAHGITVEEYKQMFPGALLIANSLVEKHKANTTLKWTDQDFVDKVKSGSDEFWDEFYENPEMQKTRSETVRRSRWNDHVKENEKSEDKIECLICHKFYKKLAGYHLSSHGITTEEYQKMFPGAPLISPSAQLAYSESKTGDKNPMADVENRDLVASGLAIYHQNHPDAHAEQGEKTKQFYIDHPEAREAARLKTIEQMKDPAARELLRQYAINQTVPNRNTSIEIKMQNILSDHKYKYELHKPCCGICQPDILFPTEKIAVFCDGDYWHNYPDGLEKDHKQDEVLTKNGWRIIRFWEHEINKNIQDCLRKFEAVYNDTEYTPYCKQGILSDWM